ncbi:TrbI/VirB10 family protein [Phenylobacterium sp.]|uniref:TrbI/VirB10 family protein n=1 Tax=Phenylobacterium sp. TaxID=1871053 RepID=UPI0035B2E437
MSDLRVPSEPGDLRLRTRPPPVMRLSRSALLIAAALAVLATVGAVAFAISFKPALQEDAPKLVAAGAPPEALRRLPADYVGPRLGPPLPGDLGRPMLAAEDRPVEPAPGANPTPAVQTPAPDHWRRSSLFLAQSRAAQPVAASEPVSAQDAARPELAMHGLQAGTMIPAALITGVRSDAPGQVLAQVTRPVHDSATGRILLIPQGARLIGTYESRTTFGQRRLALVWTRLTLAGGGSLRLDNLPAGDSQGYAGLADHLDRRWSQLFTMAGLSSLLAVGAELGADDDSDIVRSLRRGALETVNGAGQQAVGLGLSIGPTMTLRPGTPIRVILTEDLRLPAYEEQTP